MRIVQALAWCAQSVAGAVVATLSPRGEPAHTEVSRGPIQRPTYATGESLLTLECSV